MLRFFQPVVNYFVNNSSIDVESVPFNKNNPEHIKLIDEEILSFQQAYNNLFKSDLMWGGACAGLYTVARQVVLPILFFVPTMVADVAFLLALTSFASHMHNPGLKNIFDEKLNRLLNLYRWCERGVGVNALSDDSFLRILEIVAPFVTDYKQIKPINRIDPAQVSVRFAQIMAQSPHAIPPELLLDEQRAAQVNTQNHRSWLGWLNTTGAQAKRVLYNNDTTHDSWANWTLNQVVNRFRR